MVVKLLKFAINNNENGLGNYIFVSSIKENLSFLVFLGRGGATIKIINANPK